MRNADDGGGATRKQQPFSYCILTGPVTRSESVVNDDVGQVPDIADLITCLVFAA